MTGWIKMRTGLWTHPKVAVIAMRLEISRSTVIGCLHGAWSIADEHSEDGTIECLTPDMIDAQVEQRGFAEQMASVGWLEIRESGVQFPRYEEHNGATAKRRASEQKRKRTERAAANCPQPVRTPSASMRTQCGPEERRGEEKRKEQEETPSESFYSEPSPNGSELNNAPGVMEFPTVGTGEKTWNLTQAKFDEYAKAFPGLDVMAECRKARQWCNDNPEKRKTAKGMTRFLNAWLSRAQNERGGRNGNGKPLRQATDPTRVHSRYGNNGQTQAAGPT